MTPDSAETRGRIININIIFGSRLAKHREKQSDEKIQPDSEIQNIDATIELDLCLVCYLEIREIAEFLGP